MSAGGFGPSIPFDEPVIPQAEVRSDTPCRKCQYNLRGLSPEGRCPECGTPIGLSINGDLLRYSDPRWLHLLHQGVTCILTAEAVTIFNILLVVLGPHFFRVVFPTWFVSLGASFLGFLGGWLLTAPDPSGLGEDKYGRSRKIIRVTLMIGIGNAVVRAVRATMGLPAPFSHILFVISSVAALCNVVERVAELHYVSKLALRIPDFAIAARAKFLKLAVGISYGIIAIFEVLIALAGVGRRTSSAPGADFGCIVGPAGLALIVFVIMYLVMLAKLGRQFKEAKTFAERIWGSAPAAA